MSSLRLIFLVVLIPAAAAAEEPPYQRLLQGEDAKKAAALTKQIEQLWAAGKFADAAAPAQELQALRQRVQGEGHWQAADAARQVATLAQVAALTADQQTALAQAQKTDAQAKALSQRGKHAEAEPLLRKSLDITREVLGPRHPLTALGCDNLAANLNAQGRFDEAEPLYRQALAINEKVLGPRHPHTATAANNLAANLDEQGRFAEAEPLKRRALAINEAVLGPRDPATAHSYNNLAVSLQKQGRFTEAGPVFRQALALYEKALGPRHPDAVTCASNLATNLKAQGRVKEAEPLERFALDVREAVLGPRHPLTAQSYNNLANNLDDQGQPREAEPLHLKAVAICEEVLGPRHPHTAYCYNNLGMNLDNQKRFPEAEPLYRKALAIREEVLGPRHPDTAHACGNLAMNLLAQEKVQEAEPLFRKALAIREEVLGPRHPFTALSCNNLAGNLEAQGRWKEAEVLYRKSMAVCEEVLGPHHPETAGSYNNLAANLQKQGRAQDAEPFWQKSTQAKEAARLRLATGSLVRTATAKINPNLGLASCQARLHRPADAWAAAEAGLARGLLDDLAAQVALPTDPEAARRQRDRAARQAVLQRELIPLLVRANLNDDQRRRRDQLVQDRAKLDEDSAREAGARSRQAILSQAAVQKALPADAALVFWLDASRLGEHWGCVLRPSGPPSWVRLPGSGPQDAWTEDDDRVAGRLREALASRDPAARELARRLADQRLRPLAPHLAATGDLPAVRQLLAVPLLAMAGIPLEVLTDRYAVSYIPSGTVFAKLCRQHQALRTTSLLALGDPAFQQPSAASSSGARADARRGGDEIKQLPGTRIEVQAVAALFPPDGSLTLLGSDASEQRLEELAAARRLKDFRVLHLATHGRIDNVVARDSALLLARDRLPDPLEQVKRGRKPYDGRLTAATIADTWQLDADLVTLSACQTGLGPQGGGEGLLGFSQVLFGKGVRSLVLSLWKVDDTATALLMARFYANLLGKREALQAPLGRAAALREAQQWLRQLSRTRRDELAAALGRGQLRGEVVKLDKPVVPAPEDKDGPPYAHPYYWAAFVLFGDPD
jgi:CHAT domain-containing protein/Flp pilus assembly protein TadD